MVTITDALTEKLSIAIYAIDDGRFVYVNPKFADMLGYTKEELLGFASVLDIIADDRKEVVAEMLRRRAGGALPEVRYITTGRRRDGTLVDAEIHGSRADVQSSRLLIGAALEIERYPDLSRSLTDREQYFRALTKDISDVIAIVDPLGRITYVSPSIEQLLGGTWTDWINRFVVTAVHPGDRPRFSRVLDNLLTTSSFRPEEFCLRHEDGSWRDVKITATNLLTHPQVQGFAFNFRDVTERNKMQQSQRLASLGRLAAEVAHEFNNALMGIQMNTEVIRRDPANEPGVRHALLGIDSMLARSKKVTADILEFGRPPRVDLQLVRPDDLVERALEELRPQLPESIVLKVERTETPTIAADPNRMSQVLTNLVLNAKDAMARTGGLLTIGTSARKGCVHFTVTDSGEGIAPEHLQSIFEPHFTTKKRGSGLGLSVVHQIIDAHGGTISVESEPGKGTTFDICIPTTPRHGF
jgi:PAS domain S-box-containing protein